MTSYRVHAIAPARLAAIRSGGHDEHGNPLVAYPAEGWEPLRCCLRTAPAEEPIALIAYQPVEGTSPWAERGPVYIHAEQCSGYPVEAGLPGDLRHGPRILRTYNADGTLDYEHITLVPDDVDLDEPLRRLLAHPAVAEVHVRSVLAQCFAYAVTR